MEMRQFRLGELGIAGPLYFLIEEPSNVVGMNFDMAGTMVPALLIFTTEARALEASRGITDRNCSPGDSPSMRDTVNNLRLLAKQGHTHVALDYMPPASGTADARLFAINDFADVLERNLARFAG
jgi:hypothetical protein